MVSWVEGLGCPGVYLEVTAELRKLACRARWGRSLNIESRGASEELVNVGA